MTGFVLEEAFRDLRRAGWVGVTAVLLITLSLGALGSFWVLSLNLGHAVSEWRERFRVIAYLREEPSPEAVAGLLQRVEAVGGIQRLRYVSKEEALVALRESLGAEAGVVDELPANPLPASLVLTPSPEAATPAGTRELIQHLGTFPEVEEVQGGTEWVERLAHWRRLLAAIGLGVGGVLALAAILTVTTASTLVLHARRDELEIMRLVGASEAVLRMPLLLQGLVQGLLGAALALTVLWLAYTLVLRQLESLVALTLGLSGTAFLSPLDTTLLVGGGGLLGALGGLLAKGRS